MRILVVADLHGNLAALEAMLAEPHDALICLGDLVGFGPEPLACVRRIRSEARAVVQGNHDHAMAEQQRAPGGPEPFHSLAEATAPIARSELGAAELAYLGALPHWAFVDLDGMRYMLVHATPRDPLYQPLGPDPAAWMAEVEGVDADVVLVGHTHVPFDLHVGRKRVVNPGSVGFPMDGDWRAGYAVIDDGVTTLHRVPYPVERTIDALARTGVAEPAVADLSAWLRTGRVPAATISAERAVHSVTSVRELSPPMVSWNPEHSRSTSHL